MTTEHRRRGWTKKRPHSRLPGYVAERRAPGGRWVIVFDRRLEREASWVVEIRGADGVGEKVINSKSRDKALAMMEAIADGGVFVETDESNLWSLIAAAYNQGERGFQQVGSRVIQGRHYKGTFFYQQGMCIRAVPARKFQRGAA